MAGLTTVGISKRAMRAWTLVAVLNGQANFGHQSVDRADSVRSFLCRLQGVHVDVGGSGPSDRVSLIQYLDIAAMINVVSRDL